MRLIDADALSKAMYDEAFENDESYNETNPMARWDSGLWIRYKMFENTLKETPTIEPKQKWIPCSERLPEENGNALVNVCVDDAPWDIVLMPTASVKEYYKRGHINAWMPLPDPWEGDRQ